jgi:hypothetical protein
MSNLIFINVDKSITGLAGYDYGKKIYEDQVKGKVDLSKELTITFPNNIQRIASSFIQGFFEDIVEHIGLSGVEQLIKLEVSNEHLKNSIYNNLY